MKYFTEEEIQEFKNVSLKYPQIIYDGVNENNVIQIVEVVRMSGMASNDGIPLEIHMRQHEKGKEVKRLRYRLVEE